MSMNHTADMTKHKNNHPANEAYILLERVHIQNANCVAGLTYGFPAITHFLGFAHALGLKMQEKKTSHSSVSIEGCAVFCHSHHSHTYQANGFGDFTFIQRKASPTFKKHASSTPPIIEEGKMNLCVSLLLKCSHLTAHRTQDIQALEQQLLAQANRLRLAGGIITQIEAISIYRKADNAKDQYQQTRLIKRRLMPSFVLCDRHQLLNEHYQTLKESDDNADLLEAWLDFSRLTYIPDNAQADNNQQTEWKLKDKPAGGWLVPIMTGYSAIAPLQDKASVVGARNPDYDFSFVEAVYSIGEWLSTHRMTDLDKYIWQYQYQQDWYLCRQLANIQPNPAQPQDEKTEQIQSEQSDRDDLTQLDDFDYDF